MSNRVSGSLHVILCTVDPAVLATVELLGPAGFTTTRCTTAQEVQRVLNGSSSVGGVVLDAELPDGRAHQIYEVITAWQHARAPTLAVQVLGLPGQAYWETTPDRRQHEDWAQKPLTSTELALRLQALLVRTGQLDPADVWVGLARAQRNGLEPPVETGKVLAFFSAHGGVGKTTLAVHLAIGLQRLDGVRVALVDGNLWSGAVQVHLNLSPKRSIYNATQDGIPSDPEMWLRTLTDHASGLKVLAAPQDLADVERVPEDAVAGAARALARHFHYVIVDLGSVPSESALTTFDVADSVMLVATPDLAVVRSTQRLLHVGVQVGFSMRARPILNRADRGLTLAQVESVLGLPIEAIVPTDSDRFIAAANQGVTLFDTGGHASSATRRALEGLVQLVADRKHLEAGSRRRVQEDDRKRSGWLPGRATSPKPA